MVTFRRSVIKGIPYYYLEHSVRDGKKVRKIRKYLGRRLPKNIEVLKESFHFEINKQRYFDRFDQIKKGYARENRSVQESAREKEIRSFSIRFTYDSQKIEGSSLTLRETAQLLEEGITPNNKSVADVKEAEAHQKVFLEMLSYERDLRLSLILYWHEKLFKNTKPEIAGRIRKHQVTISGSKFVPPSPVEVYPMLTEVLRWYEARKNRFDTVQLAGIINLRFVSIHPFADGNGRIARLIMNFLLKKNGFPMMDINYESRKAYYNALERSNLKNDDSIFLNWFFKKYLRENENYLS